MKYATVFTNEIKFLEVIINFFNVKTVISEKEKINNDIYDFCIWKKIKIIILDKKKNNFKDILIESNYIGISYGFGIIFKKDFIKKFMIGIWNIHPGALPDYRGRHPISHAFLNNEKYIGVSIHIINEQIDSGKLLAQNFVSRSVNDSTKDIEKKIILLLKSSLIKKALLNFKKKKFNILVNKKYYPSLLSGININNPKKFSAEYIFNCFRSQYDFGGVKILGKKYLDCSYYNKEISYINKFDKIIESSDGIKLILFKKKKSK